MKTNHSSARSNPGRSNGPMWLVVQSSLGSYTFELCDDDASCVTFGSSSDADVVLEGAAPVAFVVQRDASGVWLTPADAALGLRVNTRRPWTRTQIFESTRVELFGVRLTLLIRDSSPALRANENVLALDPFSSGVRSTDGWCDRATSGDCQVPTLPAPPCDAASHIEVTPLVSLDEARSTEQLVDALAAGEGFFTDPAVSLLPLSAQIRYSLARLRLLANRHPIGAWCVAAIGSLVVFLFLVGAAGLLGYRFDLQSERMSTGGLSLG